MTSYATYPPGAHRYYPRHYPTGALGRSPMWELALLFATALLVAITTKDLVVQPFFIPSSSMEQTLHGCPGCSGDRILVNKPLYDLRSPHPGDIVVFKAPANWSETPPPKPASNPVLHGLQWAGQLVGL
ncbi:MAG TPA: S26 family signal peptidase, partial [Jatrophihabitantaceae bacterium]|nr:S26 family signal peptidase [Jatrophihabitantaceae bacterium]